MGAQQIKSEIFELVKNLKSEEDLTACYIAVERIARSKKPKANGTDARKPAGEKVSFFTKPAAQLADDLGEKTQPHDLSLILLANEIFKGSEPLPEQGEEAFEKAFKKSLKIQPSLPNRL